MQLHINKKSFISLTLIIFIILFAPLHIHAENNEDSLSLYAKSAVLIDGDSGRVLYSHNSTEILPMASTTKIMTCIIALEYGNLSDTVTASQNAVSQPEVHLGMHTGNEFVLKDLLYSLMLESHNDSAVAIAEHIGGSVEGFAALMNQKARDLGCYDTYFITPNGLDAADECGIHSTTAENLAQILRYAIKNETFLEITQTPSYSFSTIDKKRTFSVSNKNALLTMMDSAVSGKTGFTGSAGYCYAGAINDNGRSFIAVVLGCGWPPHKAYKWSDIRKLFNFGTTNYEYQEIYDSSIKLTPINVVNGCNDTVSLSLNTPEKNLRKNVLLCPEDEVQTVTNIPSCLNAPVIEGSVVGSISYTLNGTIIQSFPVYAGETVEKISYMWCFKKVAEEYLKCITFMHCH